MIWLERLLNHFGWYQKPRFEMRDEWTVLGCNRRIPWLGRWSPAGRHVYFIYRDVRGRGEARRLGRKIRQSKGYAVRLVPALQTQEVLVGLGVAVPDINQTGSMEQFVEVIKRKATEANLRSEADVILTKRPRSEL